MKVTVGFRKLNNKEARSLHSLISTISVGTSRNMKLMGHALRISEIRNTNKILVGNMRAREET